MHIWDVVKFQTGRIQSRAKMTLEGSFSLISRKWNQWYSSISVHSFSPSCRRYFIYFLFLCSPSHCHFYIKCGSLNDCEVYDVLWSISSLPSCSDFADHTTDFIILAESAVSYQFIQTDELLACVTTLMYTQVRSSEFPHTSPPTGQNSSVYSFLLAPWHKHWQG